MSRRHAATKSSAAATFGAQFSGYGAPREMINKLLDDQNIRDPVVLSAWEADRVHELVDGFIRVRFPMVLFLNKADQGGDTDRNIQRVVEKYEPRGISCVVGSAAAEVFLKQAKKKKFIKYDEG